MSERRKQELIFLGVSDYMIKLSELKEVKSE